MNGVFSEVPPGEKKSKQERDTWLVTGGDGSRCRNVYIPYGVISQSKTKRMRGTKEKIRTKEKLVFGFVSSYYPTPWLNKNYSSLYIVCCRSVYRIIVLHETAAEAFVFSE